MHRRGLTGETGECLIVFLGGLRDQQGVEFELAQGVGGQPGLAEQGPQQVQGLEDLVGALGRGNHRQYLDDPASLGQAGAVVEGNGILGHLFGSKEVSREVASRAAQSSGVDSGILKQMLPLLASAAMGAMAKQGFGNDASRLAGGQDSGIGGLLTSFLDADKDGSAMDDILGMASRFLR